MSTEYQWIQIRSRQYKSLRTSIIIEGIENGSRMIWGIKNKGKYKENENGYWYKNYPSIDKMAKKLLSNSDWFQKKYYEKETKRVLNRVVMWMGVYMVSRTDGKSGSYYEKWPQWESRIREAGLALVTSKKNATADWYRRVLTK